MRHATTSAWFSCAAFLLTASVACQPKADSPQVLRALIITGANNHDWEWTSPALRRVLEMSGRFAVDVTREPKKTLADLDTLRDYDVLVLDYNSNGRWGEPAETNFLTAVRGGVGVAERDAAGAAGDLPDLRAERRGLLRH